MNLKPHQRVNKVPGNDYVVLKDKFVSSGGKNIPPAFRLPKDSDKFLKYAEENPSSQFLEKSHVERNSKHIYLKPVKDINLNAYDKFVQLFVSNPLLIDGKKFEFGVYVVVTSIHPLRLYRMQEDVLVRFTTQPYYPFDMSKRSKYITQNIHPCSSSESMNKYIKHSNSIQESFEAILQTLGGNPEQLWRQVDESIVSVYLAQEKSIISKLYKFENTRNFFELLRFDFLIDEDFKVHAIEADPSPSLFGRFKQDEIKFEQILNSLFSLVGLSSYLHPPLKTSKKARRMMAHERNIMVFPEVCLNCTDCSTFECKLCETCLSGEMSLDLQMAYREYLSRFRARRVFPPIMTQEEAKRGIPAELNCLLSEKNKLIYQWFRGKCLLDESWC
ncbi:probable tubulin polyglutamylase ttll-15 [Cloeon dipterum]|uniref:probable tubulin polyglutamylase ttll-15 n=1 Tax=Cloeon dipterum TaxID=197152 RepID=UPI003220355E